MVDEFLEGVRVNSYEMLFLVDGIVYKKCDKIFGICNWVLV